MIEKLATEVQSDTINQRRNCGIDSTEIVDSIELGNLFEVEEVSSLNEAIIENQECLDMNSENAEEQNNQITARTTEDILTDDIAVKMIHNIQQLKSNMKWRGVSCSEFKSKLENTQTMKTSFTKDDLKACLTVLKNALPSIDVYFVSSWKKDKLVDLLKKLIRAPYDIQSKEKGKLRNRRMLTLKSLCLQQISKLPKAILNCIHAEHIFPKRLSEWQRDSPFSENTTIEDLDVKISWYSKPEYASERLMYMFHVLDSHHLFTNARVKCCSTGMEEAEINKDAWVKVARDSFNNMSGLSPAIVEDLVDKQSNAFAQKTFSSDVERIMRSNGDEREANLCALIRRWYEADDLPGLSAMERCERRLAFRDWLLEGVSLNRFPPPGNHIKGIPLIMFEGILTGVERKIQMYPFIKKGAYNPRATGSLEAENMFGEFQDLEPKGSGILRPDDVPKAMSNACELIKARLDPNRVFYMHTSKAKLYPAHELVQKSDMMERDTFFYPSRIEKIKLKLCKMDMKKVISLIILNIPGLMH